MKIKNRYLEEVQKALDEVDDLREKKKEMQSRPSNANTRKQQNKKGGHK